MMAIAKRSARNPWTTAALVVTALFVLAVAAVVVLYINFEKQTRTVEELRQQNSEVIDSRQWSSRGAIIGAKSAQQTYVGLLLDYLDEMVYAVLGAPKEDTSAEVKVQSVNKKIADFMTTIKNAYPDIASVDVKTVGLVGTMARMKDKLDSSGATIAALVMQLTEAQQIRDKTIEVSEQKVKDITAERDSLAQHAQEVQNSYDQLKALMEKSTDEQVRTLYSDLEAERERANGLNQQLLKTEAELKVASQMLKEARQRAADSRAGCRGASRR
jgi:chromosome segregation ATPase